MICDISNAYPSNIAVDTKHNVQFHFVFYGDGCKEADFLIYDSTNTTETPKKIDSHLYDARRIYYNGEEIDGNTSGGSFGGKFVNDHAYIWKVRMYEEANIGLKKYPSVHRTSGEITDPPYFWGKVQSYEGEYKDTEVPIEKNLNISLPMWMRIGTDTTYRIVTAYDETTGLCTLKNKFDVAPSSGSDYSLCSIKGYIPKDKPESNQLFIEKGITEFIGAEYTASGKTVSGYCWFMEIDGIYVAITDYDPKTGLVTLEDATFSTEESGKKYNIWTSFIDSRFYAITTKDTPVFTSAIGYADGENLLFEAELSGDHLIKYYWLDIYEDDILVETTKQIHMAKLSYYYKKAKRDKEYQAVFHVVTQDGMVNQEDTSWWVSSMTATNVTNKCKLISVSETIVGGATAIYDRNKLAMKLTLYGNPVADGTLVLGNNVELSMFNIGKDLDFVVSSGTYIIINESKALPVKSYSKSTGILITSASASEYYPTGTPFKICNELLPSDVKFRVLRQGESGTSLVGNYSTPLIYDYTCAADTDYQYIIQPYKTKTQEVEMHKWISNFYNEAVCSVRVPKGREWAIYGLTPTVYSAITNDDTRIFHSYQDDFSEYFVTDIWIAALDIDPTQSVTHNLNKVVYSGNHPKPVTVSGKSDYDSFTLSFTVGKVNCPGSKITLGSVNDIAQWKNFVAKGNLTILKDPDGNIWVGAITSDTYDKIHYGQKTEYKVTFEFTELKDIGCVLIKDEVK